MIRIKRACCFAIVLLVGCTGTAIPSNSKKEKIEVISILVSRGGREVLVGSVADTIVPDGLGDRVYKLELKENGCLTVSTGLGEKGLNTLILKVVDDKKSIVLPKNKIAPIFSLAEEIYEEKEFLTQDRPTDSWLIRLTINRKTFVYYIGEHVLSDDYLHIIDKIVEESPVEVKDYRGGA